MPANALILFGARWCAPCTAELRSVDALTASTIRLAPADTGPAPRLVLAWIDRPPPVTAARSVAIALPSVAAAWEEEHIAAAHGLPFAVMTDARGNACALQKGPLEPAMVPTLWSKCHPER